MTKQNFISMSLGSGLKYVDLLCEPDDNICTLKGILNWLCCDEHGNADCELKDCMPILRPLSDLTKEIEYGGEKFVPIEKLIELDGMSNIAEMNVLGSYIQNSGLKFVPFSVVELLILWHFDIADLISKNQAIDINTLKTNPYK